MEVKVGIQMGPRELMVETSLSSDEVTQRLTDALADDALFELSDVKGNVILVPAAKVAYVELGVAGQRKIGFGS